MSGTKFGRRPSSNPTLSPGSPRRSAVPPSLRQNNCRTAGWPNFLQGAPAALLLGAGDRECHGHAELNQHAAGYVPLLTQPASVSVEMTREGSREKRPKTVAHHTHSRKERP